MKKAPIIDPFNRLKKSNRSIITYVIYIIRLYISLGHRKHRTTSKDLITLSLPHYHLKETIGLG